MIVLSHFQVRGLLQAHSRGEPIVSISPDLGLTEVNVELDMQEVRFSANVSINWSDVRLIQEAENACFLVESGGVRKIQSFSEANNALYSLYPTRGAPTMLISGIPMHRIKDTDPYHDTLDKIKAVRPLVGRVLDTATGLGYTAIQSARTAQQVLTIEIEPCALEVARLNPWSQGLFENPKIEQVLGDSYEIVAELEDASFSRILHDPPAFNLAGDLYSGVFYHHLHRLLRNGGKLFHYVGDPQSKSGRSITAGVIRRLGEAGFQRIERAPKAFGVVAVR